jgi:predicted RNase H-like nuclease (RuvC/YqgF family)
MSDTWIESVMGESDESRIEANHYKKRIAALEARLAALGQHNAQLRAEIAKLKQPVSDEKCPSCPPHKLGDTQYEYESVSRRFKVCLGCGAEFEQ